METKTKTKRMFATGNALAALKAVKHSRHYAVDDASLLALAASGGALLFHEPPSNSNTKGKTK